VELVLKMKNKFILGLMLVLLVGIVVSQVLISKDVVLDKEQKIALADKGITAPTISPLLCDGTYCEAYLHQGNVSAGNVIIEQKYCEEYEVLDTFTYNCSYEDYYGLECEPWTRITYGECISIKEYTQEELDANLEKAVEKRLIEIADREIAKQEKQEEIKGGEVQFDIKQKGVAQL